MPMPFHLTKSAPLNGSTSSTVSGGGSGGGGGGEEEAAGVIDREDPTKVFVELTEIGHGNFGAVYFVRFFVHKPINL